MFVFVLEFDCMIFLAGQISACVRVCGSFELFSAVEHVWHGKAL